jgi:hypothetical protein
MMNARHEPPGNRRLLIRLLVGGAGAFMFVACGVCGFVGYFVFLSTSPVVGRWELTNNALAGNRIVVEFRTNGTGTIQGRGIDVDFDYTVSRAAPVQLEWQIKRAGKFAVRGNGNLEIKANDVVLIGAPLERFQVTVLQDGLILANQNGAPHLTMRRVR